MTTMTQSASTQVTVGVDTHLDVHVAVVKDQLGRRLATTSVATTPAGYAELLGWAEQFGPVEAWGIEGTGSFGAALTRFLRAHGQVVVEVNRPTGPPGVGGASPTPWTPKPRPGLSRPGKAACPRPATGWWR
jgi:transposase